jgi:glucuronate isomerase
MYSEYSDHTIADDRSRKLPVLLLLLGALALLAALAYWVLNNRHNQVTAAAPGVYGAIATSQSSLDFGSAWGYSDSAAAVRRALTECNARVTHADCVARVSLNNDCTALVVSPVRGQSVVATESDKTLASALALAQCVATGAEDCVVRQNFCGDGS